MCNTKEEIYGIVYKITNTKNNKVYIGITTKKHGFRQRYGYGGDGIERVYNFHKRNQIVGGNYNSHLLWSIEKYGFKNFKVDEVFDVAYSESELKEKEINYIKKYKSNNQEFGYNHTDGGDGCFNKSTFSKIKARLTYSINNKFLNRETKVAVKTFKKKYNECRICGVIYLNKDGKNGYCKHCQPYSKYYIENRSLLDKLIKDYKDNYVLDKKEEEFDIDNCNVYITKKELDFIRNIKLKSHKMLAFGYLAYAKAINNKCGKSLIIDKELRVRIFKDSNANCNGERALYTLNKMVEENIFKTDKDGNILIDYYNDESEKILEINSFINLGFQCLEYFDDKKIKRCSICGDIIKVKSNIQKYCEDCKLQVKKERSGHSVKAKRLN